MIKVCQVCGAQFAAKRSDARFCSATCRTRNFRGSYVPPLHTPTIAVVMDAEEVQAIVASAHHSASDLSRASQHTDPPLSRTLGRVAADFEESLRREGL